MTSVNELQRTVDGEEGATLPEIHIPRCLLSWTLLANGTLDCSVPCLSSQVTDGNALSEQRGREALL